MTKISTKLEKKFSSSRKRKLISFSDIQEVQLETNDILNSVNTSERLKDHDPLYAVHIILQNLVSVFAEQVSIFSELNDYYIKIAAIEEAYMPGYPPLSPITHSYFTMWVFYDFEFGDHNETIGNLLLDISDSLGFPDDLIPYLNIQMNSHMGIYEHCGFDEDKIILQDIMTKRHIKCYCSSGYQGEQGELWYTRLLSSPYSMLDYEVAFTTPYLLQSHGKDEWLEYLTRNGITPDDANYEKKYHAFMKQGKTTKHWHEFILKA